MKPYKECPRFDSCSANDCPLNPMKLESLPDDPETECRAQPSVRLMIADMYNLSNRGMTDKEIKREARRIRAKKRWNDYPDEKKEKILNNIRPYTKKGKNS